MDAPEDLSRRRALAAALSATVAATPSLAGAVGVGPEPGARDTVAFLKRIYTHDRVALFGAMKADFKLHSPGQNLIAGTYVGPEGFTAHVNHMKELCGDTFREELQDTFLANENWGLVVHRMTAERNGRRLDMWGFGLWRFEDGMLTDHWEAVGDQKTWDEFWS